MKETQRITLPKNFRKYACYRAEYKSLNRLMNWQILNWYQRSLN